MKNEKIIKVKTYSDDYINCYADFYMTLDNKYALNNKGIRFEAFLAQPKRYIKILSQTHNVQELIDKHELEIEKLPGGGTRYGAYFQRVRKKKKQRHHRKAHITEQRIHA